MRGVVIPEMVAAKFKDLKRALIKARKGSANDEIEVHLKKLIKADEYLETNGTLAIKYLDTLDKTYLGSDDAADETDGDGGAQVQELDDGEGEDGEEEDESDESDEEDNE